MFNEVIKLCVALVIVIAIIAILLCGCSLIAFKFLDNKVPVTEEITNVFEENKALFVDVTNEFLEFDYDWSIRKRKPDVDVRPDWQVTNIKRGINLVVHDSDYFDEPSLLQCLEEHTDSIEGIFKDVQFKIISHNTYVDPGCIYFTAYTEIGFSSGIIYSPNGEPKNPYIIKLKKLENSWYYYEEK